MFERTDAEIRAIVREEVRAMHREIAGETGARPPRCICVGTSIHDTDCPMWRAEPDAKPGAGSGGSPVARVGDELPGVVTFAHSPDKEAAPAPQQRRAIAPECCEGCPAPILDGTPLVFIDTEAHPMTWWHLHCASKAATEQPASEPGKLDRARARAHDALADLEREAAALATAEAGEHAEELVAYRSAAALAERALARSGPAVAAEREACAKVAEALLRAALDEGTIAYEATVERVVAAIRAR